MGQHGFARDMEFVLTEQQLAPKCKGSWAKRRKKLLHRCGLLLFIRAADRRCSGVGSGRGFIPITSSLQTRQESLQSNQIRLQCAAFYCPAVCAPPRCTRKLFPGFGILPGRADTFFAGGFSYEDHSPCCSSPDRCRCRFAGAFQLQCFRQCHSGQQFFQLAPADTGHQFFRRSFFCCILGLLLVILYQYP